ncbi:ABC transporter transmembrane domain-containing protein [Aeromonas schubertii]|uniref:ABC transporter transmembrane domain-containing protein n=1 Tax=Aeromonas schubertii TaxID=652 RepID=UPI001CC4D5D2|nr:ABC transporter transmembrane domain-containing protein [Aeromonas schubertii]MBZ6072050.1 ATP-binding cassette domain-containing protein [Aeromonas schubertii]
MNSTVKRLLAYALEHRGWLIRGLGWLMLATAAEVAGPLLIKLFIDDYLAPRQMVGSAVATLALAYLTLQLLSALGFYRQSLQFNHIAQAVVQRLREQVFATAIRLPASYFDKHRSGALISRITNDTEAIMNLYVQVIGQFVQKLVLLFAILCSMALLDLRLMLVCAALVPSVGAIMWLYQRWSVPVVRATRSLLSDINSRLNESLQGMTVIQTLVQERRFAEEFAKVNGEHREARLRGLKINGLLLRPLIDLLYMLVLVGLLSLFAWEGQGSGAVQVGVLYAFISYLGRMIEPIIEITNQLGQLQQSMVAGERVFELLDEVREPSAGADILLVGRVAFDGVGFSYDGVQPVLSEVDFEISSGEMLALVGHTGSGKSTIISLLMGYYPAGRGEIRLDGRPLGELGLAGVRRQMGLVQQDPFIFAGTLADNIRLGREGIDEQRLWQVLAEVQLDHFVRSLPQGLDSELDEGGKNLSAGQRQLLSFARALACNPRILILDEATASVDSQTEAALSMALVNARRGRTTIAVAHRLSTIVDADEILLLSRGQVQERGTHDALMAKGGHYAHLFDMQSQGAWRELEGRRA